MTLEEARELFRYDVWANRRTIEICAALSPEQFTRDMGSSFGSVRDTLLHIYGAQWTWLERLNGYSSEPSSKRADKSMDLAAVRPFCSQVEIELLAYVQALTAADLDRHLEYRNSQGQSFRNPIRQILQHLANHGTYHRGQITTLLRQLGAKPVTTDLIAFYRAEATDSANRA